MILYHGTNVDIDKIDFAKCNPNKDFGQGFFLTDIKEQAFLMAKRRVRINKYGQAVVLEYFFDESCLNDASLNIKIFEKTSEEWARFILENRKSSTTAYKHNYDIVIGPIADDGVVFQLERFENKMITIDVLVEELSYKNLNRQYYFGTENAISKLTKMTKL